MRPKKSGYLPSLDGWRALAILGVMMTHDTPWVIGSHSNAGFKGYGGYGVQLFFAISGLLITSRILEEEELIGRFEIKRFYIRRFFRIQPAALAFLAVVALLIATHLIHDHWYYWFAALFMFENFAWTGMAVVPYSFFVGHFWTLAVEEHFYILLSLLLYFFRKFRLAALVFIYLLLALLERHATHRGWITENTDRRTYWQLSYLVYPAALAVLLRSPSVSRWVAKYMRPGVTFLTTALLIFLHHYEHQIAMHGGYGLPRNEWSLEIGFTVRYILPLWVVATMTHGQSWTTRVLESAPLRWMGRLSYSLYLWHLLFFFHVYPGTNITNPVQLALAGRPMRYISAFCLAALSYYFIEKPMIRFGHKLAPSATPGRPELVDLPTEVPVKQPVVT